MKMKKRIYEKMLSVKTAPPEIGGIIGGRNGVVDEIFFDDKNTINERAVYLPNVELLNSVIESWEATKIEFMGMFHSHPKCQDGYSDDDLLYIGKIMRSMPTEIRRLYFPIIIPGKKIVCYSAKLSKGKLAVAEEHLEIY